MALISYPECQHNISDKATSCPNCGHPLQQNRGLSLYNILLGKRWKALSHTLGPGGSFDMTFMNNGGFIALLTGDGYFTPLAQQINGKWQVIESQLFLDYVYTMLGNQLINERIQAPTHIQIQFTQGSESRLLGVDTSARAWELVRIG